MKESDELQPSTAKASRTKQIGRRAVELFRGSSHEGRKVAESPRELRERRREQIFGVDAIVDAIENPATEESTVALTNAVKALCHEDTPGQSEGSGGWKERQLHFKNLPFGDYPFERIASHHPIDRMLLEESGHTHSGMLFLTYHPGREINPRDITPRSGIEIYRGFNAHVTGVDGIIDGPAAIHDRISTHRTKSKLIIEREIKEHVPLEESLIQEVASIKAVRELSEAEAQAYFDRIVEVLPQDDEYRADLEQLS